MGSLAARPPADWLPACCNQTQHGWNGAQMLLLGFQMLGKSCLLSINLLLRLFSPAWMRLPPKLKCCSAEADAHSQKKPPHALYPFTATDRFSSACCPFKKGRKLWLLSSVLIWVARQLFLSLPLRKIVNKWNVRLAREKRCLVKSSL